MKLVFFKDVAENINIGINIGINIIIDVDEKMMVFYSDKGLKT